MKLFVSGRICLFGEHSDWAGGYRRINSNLEKGYTIITGTNQGLYAEVKHHPSKLIFHSTLDTGERIGPLELPMKTDLLLKEAQKGGFFSYAAGVAYQVLTHYRVSGLEIDNYKTDLPVKKGLSSSAALCVLVARAFNRLYDLKMTIRGEMEYAYLGEITTPSRCGRMDQGCAFGNRPILMVYDGDMIDVHELRIPRDLHYVIVDLKAEKDTREILAHLNSAFPFADNDLQKDVQDFLGPVNKRINSDARNALESGKSEELGILMSHAQTEFDKHLQPACPSQLTAPILHRLLSYEPLRPYIFGGKGVGSQGDGTAQLLARDKDAQKSVIEIIEQDLGMECLALTISATPPVRKAVIPAAGFGTHLYPATKAMKKELFPVIDSDGAMKPAILAIVEEAQRAGIEEIGIIIQPEDRRVFEEFFSSNVSVGNLHKLSRKEKEYTERILKIGERVTLIEQEQQLGFGHAVHCASEWVGHEPFLLMLGDHVYVNNGDKSCAEQIIGCYNQYRANVVGLAPVTEHEVGNFGCVHGVWDSGNILDVLEIAEKPSVTYAREQLVVDGMPDDTFLSLFGLYILQPHVFTLLEEAIRLNGSYSRDIGLTPVLERLRQEEGMIGVVIDGRRYDIADPESYRKIMADGMNK